LNQTDLIQKIIATEHQAQALTEHAKQQQENMEASINSEIEALRVKYQAEAEAYLQQLMQAEHEKSAQHLQALDDRLTVKLQQVESVYAAQKDQWVQAIFERIVGKAGG
jgi:phosphoserine phosphatase